MTKQNPCTGSRPGDPSRDPKLRAGDRDRDAVAEQLRTQHAEGRLDSDELDHRIDSCYDAKTLHELDQLLADLPRVSRATEEPGWHPGRWRAPWLSLAPLFVTLAVISALTGKHLIWLAIPLVFAARFARSRHQSWLSRSDHDLPAEGAS
jgi:hypothetical protein